MTSRNAGVPIDAASVAAGAMGSIDDEDALADMIDIMYSSCGNNGQTAIIDKVADDFEDFVMPQLEDAEEAQDWSSWYDHYIQLLGQSEYNAVDLILEDAYNNYAAQTHYHDGYDEQGEGTGEEVG